MAGVLGRVLATIVLVLSVVVDPGSAVADESPRLYTNPISAAAADTFADPVLIRGKDGFWYAVSTSDPLREGEIFRHQLPILRSADLTTWEHVADVFSTATRPVWMAPDAELWAPDIRYVDGRYLLYFMVTDTNLYPGGDSAIGVATADSPVGPWSDAGGPLVAPRPDTEGGFKWTFDPAMFTDSDGTRWLYYGSYLGGLVVVPLSADGLRVTGEEIQISTSHRYEGAYVVRHGDWYYLFGSASNCCAGPTAGYSVFAARARGPAGPFIDRDGDSLLESRTGGTPVLQPNGNTWIGTGHNAMIRDTAGQEWLVYHAIDRDDPYLNRPFVDVERPMLLDRLDWIDDWPVVRAGAGASDGPQRAPVVAGPVGDRFERSGLGPGWRTPAPGWAVLPATGTDSGGLLRHGGPGRDRLWSTARIPADLQFDVDLRLPREEGAAGVTVRLGADGEEVTATIDRRAGALVVDLYSGGGHDRRATPLPRDFRYGTWHTLSVRIDGRTLTASVTEDRLGNPVAQQARSVPPRPRDGALALTADGAAELDNVSAAPAARLGRNPVPTPEPGRLDRSRSDEFGTVLDPAWRWVRPDPAATVAGGALRWPAQAADLVGTTNNAGVLLRDAPDGDYLVETKLGLALGEDSTRNYQQAGLIAYAGDDDFARLSQVAIWNTRQLEYGRELPYAGALSFGGMALTAPAETTWLRLAHSVGETGEHRFRSAASRDGEHWTWGGTWTFPAGPAPRIGLVAHGGDTPPVTAVFDYFRVYRR
ncbi:family 43 glycosylhydrolase [Amycolatopsis nigrescens]|uniref:family 43 glycosylhydrolase n=1 Tax=Amycolatopsis nigrescens TaxID=381445 RepID=UPI000477AAA8|nr:family 43 glycosylhydrolase [Amycolatopsis nigrescens]